MKIALLISSLFVSTLVFAKETIQLHEIGKYYKRDRVVHVEAGLVVNKKDEVLLSTKIITQDRGIFSRDCSGEREGTFCRNHYESHELADFSYEPETKLVRYGERICGKLKKRWFGKYIKMVNGCKIKVKRKRTDWKVNLVLK